MQTTLDKLQRRIHKLNFYFRHIPLGLLPFSWIQRDGSAIDAAFRLLPDAQQQMVLKRVNYYNQLIENTPINPADFEEIAGNFRRRDDWNSSYYYDLLALIRYFPANSRFNCLFGDVTHIPDKPSFVKSRPITPHHENANAVVLKLDSFRHFYLYSDPYATASKIPKLVWRGAAHQAHRKQFLAQFHDKDWCDVGCVHANSLNQPYHAQFMGEREQLRYRYILSIEGNDVATNLKWILASNSLAVCAPLRYETWLMEGLLQSDVHFIGVESDYSNLEEKLQFYEKHPQSAAKIVQNAQQWMVPFQDAKLERLVSLMVIRKYLVCLGQ